MAITYCEEFEMHCDISTDSDSHHSPIFDLDSAITFDEIRRDDKVVIRTQNSEYRFSVIDPQKPQGDVERRLAWRSAARSIPCGVAWQER
jgi:hypothetical protein